MSGENDSDRLVLKLRSTYTSYEAQIDYYTKLIKGHDGWQFVEVYTDEGISGTNTKHRDGFNRMIEDALAALLQKKFTTDFLTKKQKVNEGEVPQYYVRESHPAIIDPQLWELTQMEMSRRRAIGKNYSGNSIFSARIVCGECGCFYGPRYWNTRSQGRRIVWRCAKKYGKDGDCESPIVTENELKMKFVEALNDIVDERELVLDRCRSLYESFLDTSGLDDEITDHVRECEILAELSRRLVEENARQEMDQDEFMRRHGSYASKFDAESAKVEQLKDLRMERLQKAEAVSAFMFEIHEQERFIEDFSEKLWLTTIENVTVYHDGRMVFRFKNGMEVTK